MIDFFLRGLKPTPLKAFLLENRAQFETFDRFKQVYSTLESHWKELNFNEKGEQPVTAAYFRLITEKLTTAYCHKLMVWWRDLTEL